MQKVHPQYSKSKKRHVRQQNQCELKRRQQNKQWSKTRTRAKTQVKDQYGFVDLYAYLREEEEEDERQMALWELFETQEWRRRHLNSDADSC